jgi:hypothetical protein
VSETLRKRWALLCECGHRAGRHNGSAFTDHRIEDLTQCGCCNCRKFTLADGAAVRTRTVPAELIADAIDLLLSMSADAKYIGHRSQAHGMAAKLKALSR